MPWSARRGGRRTLEHARTSLRAALTRWLLEGLAHVGGDGLRHVVFRAAVPRITTTDGGSPPQRPGTCPSPARAPATMSSRLGGLPPHRGLGERDGPRGCSPRRRAIAANRSMPDAEAAVRPRCRSRTRVQQEAEADARASSAVDAEQRRTCVRWRSGLVDHAPNRNRCSQPVQHAGRKPVTDTASGSVSSLSMSSGCGRVNGWWPGFGVPSGEWPMNIGKSTIHTYR